MAKHTNTVILTTEWQAITAGQDTALISMDPARAGFVAVAIADADTDLDEITDTGHRMTPSDFNVVNFFGLDGKLVCARKYSTSDTVALIVTAYSPV